MSETMKQAPWRFPPELIQRVRELARKYGLADAEMARRLMGCSAWSSAIENAIARAVAAEQSR